MANPDQPPTTDSPSPQAGGPFEAVLRIATLQRHLNLAVLANMGVSSFLAGLGGEIPILLPLLAAVATVIFSIITSLRIANALYGRNWSVVCAVLMFVPLVNLITLLALSSGATRRLRKEGIKVGFLGADLAAVRARIKTLQTECVHCAFEIRAQRPGVLCKVCKRSVHRDCRREHRAQAHG
jgi:hypothetical protein